jgi:acyl-CoA synthetase (AMP-forming)/AMP-acid ligase II
MGWIIDKLYEHKNALFIKDSCDELTYRDTMVKIRQWSSTFKSMKIDAGDCIGIIGQSTSFTLVLLLSLLENDNIVLLPLNHTHNIDRSLSIACVDGYFKINDKGKYNYTSIDERKTHRLLQRLKASNEAGMIMLTSGSTGESKAVVHQFTKILMRLGNGKKHAYKTLVFLKLDHIGGINTILSAISNGGSLILADDRNPAAICKLIEKHGIELLPTTPSFLNMLIMSKMYQKFDLSSLKLITYGTEPMHRSTLKALNGIFKGIKIKQTYGLTELGILSTQSKNNNSNWMKIGGYGVEHKIVDNTLRIKCKSSMLGYLNAEDTNSSDGWYDTRDEVEIDGEYIRVLGRKEDIINVGGEKVFPAEIESVLLEVPEIKDVTVRAKKNPIMGNIVEAIIQLNKNIPIKELILLIHNYCEQRLESHKIPRIVTISDKSLVGSRYKKIRGLT